MTMRCCNNCGESGHNTRIYKKDEEMSNVYNSECDYRCCGRLIEERRFTVRKS